MNKIFRVIWNHATQSWVAVSELASAKGKTKSKTNKVMLASLVVGSSVIASTSNSFAATISTTINNGIGINGKNIYVKPDGGTVTAETSGTSTIEETISIGTSSRVRDGEILIGNNIRNTATGNSADVVIGHRALLGGGGQDSMSTGVGYGIQVAGPSIALGVGARADIADASGWNAVKNGGTAIGAYSMIGGNKNGSLAVGAIAAADANGAVALGTLSGSATQWLDYADRGLGFNTRDTIGTYTTSVGYKSGARGFDSVAVGVNAYTGLDRSAQGAVAVGNSTRAYGEGSLALGNRSVAGGYTDAMITQLNTKKTQVEAELTKAKERLAYWNERAAKDASAYNKFNVGNLNAIVARLELTLERTNDDLTRALTAKGIPSSITSNFALAVGAQAEALSESSTAIGTLAKSYAQNGLAIGRSSNITNVNSTNSIAIGTDARVTGDTSTSSLAIGHGSNVSGKEAIAIGRSTAVSGANSVALGSNITKLTTANSVVLGASSTEVVGTTGASHAVQAVNDATVRTIAGPNFTYSGFVGKPADDGHYVSIGQAGKERQIKNLAAGAVAPTSTDAINGSQLYALMDRVENKQEPVVYTNKDGDKLVKVGNDFYKTGDLDPATGKPLAGKTPVSAGDVIASMNNAGNNTTTPMALANIAGNLPGAKNGSTAPTTSGKLPEGADAPNTSNAATVGDVLNADWNLTEKGVARDFVKPYDTVDFIDGKGTSVNVTRDTDGKVSHIKYDVKAADDSITVGDDGIKVNTGGITPVTKDDGDKKSGQVAPNKGDENKVASVGDVANAINNAFWKVTGAEDGGKFADGNTTTEEQVKAGDKVTFKAGKNIKLKQDGKNFTYSLNPELTDITSIGGNGTTMTFKPEGVSLGGSSITDLKPNLPKVNDADRTVTMPDGTVVDAAPENVTKAPMTAEEAADMVKNAGNNAATVSDVLNAGWNLQNNGEAKDFVKPYDTVNFVDGKGTKAVVESDNETSNVTFNVDTVDMTSNPNGTVENPMGDNAKQLLDDLAAAKKAVADNPDDEAAKAKLKDAEDAVNKAGGNKIATAQNVANMINNSGFTLKADETDGKNETTDATLKKDGELIKPGSTVTMKAGKNMTVKHEANGNITYATKDDVEFNTVKVGNKEDGKSPVEFKTEAAKPATNNVAGKQPTTALNVTSADGNPTQITGVASSLNKAPVTTAPNVNLVDLNSPNVNSNAAATVGDLQNMGWVVSTKDGNGYIADVKNANHVDFKAGPGISVTGKTTDDGIREITIGVKDGEVVKPNQFTAKVNGVDTPVTKVGDEYYNTADIDPKTGKAKDGVNPVTPDAGTTPTNAGDGYVTGNKVATAIQKSGFVVGKQTEKLSAADFNDKDEKVNPDDELRFADGNNTKVKLATKESIDKDGNKVTTTTVKVDVTGLPVQYTDKNGTPVTKVGDKYFTVDDKGNPTTTEVAPADLTTNMVNPAAAPNEIGAPTTLGNVKSNLPSVNDEDKNAKDVAGNPIAGKDNKSAPITATEAADLLNPKTADGKANPKFAGNNAATVSDVLNTGWNLQNNGEAKDFVKPYDTVNFVDGKGTKAVVETTPNGTTSNVKFDIDTGSITNNADGSVQGPVVTPEMTKALEDATNALNSLPPTAPAAVIDAAKKAVADAANNIANVANKVATAQDVANAINKSGFTLSTSANGGEKISGTPEMINPGKKVEMVAGKNMTVKQESNGKVTYATASNVTFDSVQFGDKGPKITNKAGNINVSGPDGKTPTKVTGVAPGEISATSKDAINGSQLYAVAAGIGHKLGDLDNKINKVGKRGDAGTASALAAANIPQAYTPGKSLVGIAAGSYQGQNGLAVGMSRISDNGKIIIRLSGTANSQGKTGVAAGVGYQW